MKSTIYKLGKLKRQLDFPYPLSEIGLMISHVSNTLDRVLDRYFFCFSFNREKYQNNGTEVLPPLISILVPGTYIGPKPSSRHDELFFSYPESASPALDDLLKNLPADKRKGFFKINEEFKENLSRLQELLELRMTIGCADKLDVLAMQIIISGIAGMTTERPPANGETAGIKIHELALKLKQGVPLETLLHQYGYSRRAFYYEWNKNFSYSPKQYLLEHNLKKAQDLLVQSELSINEIALSCGFSSSRFFHKFFLERLHCTPGEYRKQFPRK